MATIDKSVNMLTTLNNISTRVNNTLAIIDNRTAMITNNIKKTLSIQNTMNKTVNKYSNKVKTTNYHYTTVINQQSMLNKAVDEGTDKAKSFGDMMKAAYSFIGPNIGKFVQGADAYVDAMAKLSTINDGNQTTEALKSKIQASANRSRIDQGAMMDMVTSFANGAGSGFGSNNEMVAFTELVAKSVRMAGGSQDGQQALLDQLASTMSGGKMDQNTMGSILSDAPMISDAIANEMNVSVDKLEELAQKGKISANTVKMAMFNSASAINDSFAETPMKFSEIGTMIQNKFQASLQPAMARLTEWLSSADGSAMFASLEQALTTMGQVLTYIVDLVGRVGAFFVQNWGFIEPIIWTIVGALVVYNAISLISAAIDAVKNTVTAIQTAGLIQAAAAQWGLNAAILANPITWIIVAIIAVIAAIAAWVKHVGGVKVAWLMTVNAVLTAVDMLRIGFRVQINRLLEMWDNFIIGFRASCLVIQNIIGDMKVGGLLIIENFINRVIDSVNELIGYLNKIPGVSIDTIANVSFAAEAQAKNEMEKKARKQNFDTYVKDKLEKRVQRQNDLLEMVEQAKDRRRERLDEIEKARQEAMKKDDKNSFDSLLENVTSIESNTDGLSDAVDMNNEVVEYMRDLAGQEAINRFTTAEIKVDLGGVTNNVNDKVDLDGMINYLEEELYETMNIAAEGVYA